MRQILTAAVAAMVLTVAITARGQENPATPASQPGTTIPVETRIDVQDPAQQACMLRCLDPQGSAAVCEEARRHAREGWRRLLERISTIEIRIETLTADYAGLTGRVDRIEGELRRLREQLEELRGQLEQIATLVVAIEQRLGRLDATVGTLQGDLDSANGRIDALTERVTALEERRWITYRPASAGAVVLFGRGFTYSGALIGLGGLELNLTSRFDLVLGGGLLVDGGTEGRPIGTFVEGTARWNIRRSYGVWGIGLNVRGMWSGLSRSLHARAAFITAGPEVSFRPARADWLEIRVSVPAGVGLLPNAAGDGYDVRGVAGVAGDIVFCWKF